MADIFRCVSLQNKKIGIFTQISQFSTGPLDQGWNFKLRVWDSWLNLTENIILQ